jgi:uncharacterized membrane protein
MRPVVIAFVVVGLAVLVLDAIWLSAMIPGFYRQELGPALLDQPDVISLAALYVLYVAGTVSLAVLPGVDAGGWSAGLWRGALLGLVAFSTLNLTNQAALHDWPSMVTAVDIAWGTLMTAVSSAVAAALVLRYG